MSEIYEQSNTPNYHESIAPESRFVRIANAIIEKSGEQIGANPNNKAFVWPNKPEGYYYKVQVVVTLGIWGQPSFVFSLEHHITELPDGRPLVRYAVTSENGKTSSIGVYDANGKPKELSKEDRHIATIHALDILTQAAPREAQEIFDDVVDYRFKGIVGSYVLSKYAVEGTAELMDEFGAMMAAEEHARRVQEIESKVLTKSSKHDSPAKHETIAEAVATRRTKTDKNNYTPVDVHAATDRVFRMIGPKWRYHVRDDQ